MIVCLFALLIFGDRTGKRIPIIEYALKKQKKKEIYRMYIGFIVKIKSHK